MFILYARKESKKSPKKFDTQTHIFDTPDHMIFREKKPLEEGNDGKRRARSSTAVCE
jgi:hypothetical protein